MAGKEAIHYHAHEKGWRHNKKYITEPHMFGKVFHLYSGRNKIYVYFNTQAVVCKQMFLCKQADWRGQPLLVEGRNETRARKG